MSLNLIFTTTPETVTSLITVRLKRRPSHQTPITSFDMHVCVYELAATSVTSPILSSVGVHIWRMWLLSSQGSDLSALSSLLCAIVSAVKTIDGNVARVTVRHNISLIHSAVFIVLEVLWGPHSHNLINVKSLHTGCQRAVGGAADEVAPDVCCSMKRDALWVSDTHTHAHTVANHSHTLRGLCGHTCVRLCVYSSWWLMQGKSRWVKTTSVRCSVWEAIIYSLCTKLPSNLALFITPL